MITAILLFIIAAILIGPKAEELFGPAGTKIALAILGVLTVVLYIIKDISNSSSGSSDGSTRGSSGGGYTVDELEEFDMMDEDK